MVDETQTDVQRRESLLNKAAIFTASFLFLLCTMNRQVNVYDESLILEGASRVASGAIPHRDFYANYGPAQFYALASLFKILGPSVLIERLWDTAIRASIVTCSYILTTTAASRREGFLATIVISIWLASLKNYGFPVFPSLLSALVAAICLKPLFSGQKRKLSLFISGLALGLTVLFRYDVGFYAIVALSFTVTAFAVGGPGANRHLTSAVYTLAPCWAGVALVCVPVAVAFAVYGVIYDFKLDIIDFPTHFYPSMRGLPFPGLQEIIQTRGLAVIYLPPVTWIVASALVATRSWRHDRSSTAVSFWIILTLLILSILFYLKGLVRVSPIHMALSIVPALIVVSILLRHLRWPLPSLLPRSTLAAVIALYTGAGYLTLYQLKSLSGDSVHNVKSVLTGAIWKTADVADADLGSCRPAIALARLACFATDDDRARTIAYVADNSRPGDTVFAGVPHHDQIFVNDILLYFVADRRPATKWYQFDPGLQTSEYTQSEMVENLKLEKPVFVIIDDEWSKIREPNNSAISSGVLTLDDFIARHYTEVKRFGALTVLRPNDL